LSYELLANSFQSLRLDVRIINVPQQFRFVQAPQVRDSYRGIASAMPYVPSFDRAWPAYHFAATYQPTTTTLQCS